MQSIPGPIGKPKQLLVEGPDEIAFFQHLLAHLEIADVQIQSYGGTSQLKKWFKGFVRVPNFHTVESIGIVQDADENASSAFDRVCNVLTNAGQKSPDRPFSFSSGKPRINIGILPGPDAQSGMLEDLCLMTVEDDSAMACVISYLDCIQTLSDPPKNLAKAKLQAFLASRKEPTIGLRRASEKGDWNWNHPALSPIVDLLKSL